MQAERRAIVLEIYKALERLDAPHELLSTVGSWGDTLDDETVLLHMRSFNRRGTIFKKVICRRED